jgi:hypothetical protein
MMASFDGGGRKFSGFLKRVAAESLSMTKSVDSFSLFCDIFFLAKPYQSFLLSDFPFSGGRCKTVAWLPCSLALKCRSRPMPSLSPFFSRATRSVHGRKTKKQPRFLGYTWSALQFLSLDNANVAQVAPFDCRRRDAVGEIGVWEDLRRNAAGGGVFPLSSTL